MIKELTCIGCPMGCRITATLENGAVTRVEGNTCNIGKKYAEEEMTTPRRMVTALVRVSGTAVPLCVKTDRPIEKSKIFDCLNELDKFVAKRPVHIGDIVLRSVCGTDVNIVATREL
ncbi:MAG: DUF1667 domain-containing protein [Oscillospiraceae bacterium]